MNFYRIKSKDDQQYGNCLWIAKHYEKEFFEKGKKNTRIILDDCNSKVIVKDEIEYKLSDDLYLQLYDDLLEYRQELRKE
jgi:hypothetical protein